MTTHTPLDEEARGWIARLENIHHGGDRVADVLRRQQQRSDRQQDRIEYLEREVEMLKGRRDGDD